MRHMDISVVIPTYRRPVLLNRCLDALRAQVFDEGMFEVIVVTDGPDVTTVQAIMHRDDWYMFKVCSLEIKKGPAAARNHGWRMGGGKLVLFTDDDCIPGPYWVRSYWLAHQVCVHQGELGRTGDRPLAFKGPVSVPCPLRPTDYEKNIAGLATAEFVTANCACSRLALELTGGFDEAFAMAWREDSDLEFRLIRHAITIVHVSAARVTHPVRRAGWGVSLREQKKSMYNALLYKKDPVLFRRKIYRQPYWSYYATIYCVVAALFAVSVGHMPLAAAAAGGWALLTGAFIFRRLKGASRSFSHVTEMIVTSMLIPFLSIYWTWYGSVRFKTFFL
jgi:glycosyltransferase involved in cell wall biosynthesis